MTKNKITIPDCDGVDLTLLTVALIEHRNVIQHFRTERTSNDISWDQTLTRLDKLIGNVRLEADDG